MIIRTMVLLTTLFAMFTTFMHMADVIMITL